MDTRNFLKSKDCQPIKIITKMGVDFSYIGPRHTDKHGITFTKTYQFNKISEEKPNVAAPEDMDTKIPSINYIGENAYHCTYCDKAFATYDELEKHRMIHAKEKPNQCCYCHQIFSNTLTLGAHYRICDIRKNRIHSSKCSVCVLYLSQGKSIDNQIRKYTGMKVDRKYTCSYCNKVYSRRSLLVVHLRKHNGEKPFQCNYCGKSFAERCNLTRHLKVHTGERPYQCNYCGKGFSQNGDLKRHIMTHTGTKPHQCSYCKKTFTEKRTLVTHYRTHTGEKPYKCKHCNKAFTQKGNLDYHMRNHDKANTKKVYYARVCPEPSQVCTKSNEPINLYIDKEGNQPNETCTEPTSLVMNNNPITNPKFDIITEMAYAAACMAEEVNPNKFRKVMNQYLGINNLPLLPNSVSDQYIKDIYESEKLTPNSHNTTFKAKPEIQREGLQINKETLDVNANNSSSLSGSEFLQEPLLANTESLPLNANLSDTPSVTVSVAQDEAILENATVLSISDLHFSSDMIEIQM